MFKLELDPKWTWPVTVRVPVDGGVFEERKFRAHYRLIPDARRREIDAMPEAESIPTLLREGVVKVMDIVDEAGELLPHSPEIFEALIGVPWIRMGMLMSYLQAMAGTAPTPAEAGN